MIWLVVAVIWFALLAFGLAIVSMSKPVPQPLSRNPNVARVPRDAA